MHGVLHLHSSPCDFQTSRSLELILRNLGPEVPMTSAGVGPGADYRNIPEAVLRLRLGRSSQTQIAQAWGPAELVIAAAAGFSRIIFSPQERIHRRWWPWINRIVRRGTIGIVCPTSFLRESLVSQGAPARACHVVFPAIDVARLDGSRPEVRADFGLADTDIVLLAPGESAREASHRQSLWSAEILHVLDSRWRLLVWGRGPMVGSLQRFAKANGSDEVLVVAENGFGKGVELEQTVLAADAALVFANPGSPVLPLGVCMAAGVPIVAAETPEIHEFLRDELNALIEPSVNPRRLAQRVLSLQKQPSLREGIVKRGRTQALEHFSANAFVESWRAIYSRL